MLHGTVLAKYFSPFGILARAAPQVITESTSVTTIKKTFADTLYLLLVHKCQCGSFFW